MFHTESAVRAQPSKDFSLSEFQPIRKINTHLSTEKTRAIFPMARILFLITSFLTAGAPPEQEHERTSVSGGKM